MKKLKVRKC